MSDQAAPKKNAAPEKGADMEKNAGGRQSARAIGQRLDRKGNFAKKSRNEQRAAAVVAAKQMDQKKNHYPILYYDKENVFSSGLLDDLLGQKMEAAKADIFPVNLAMEGISEVGEAERDAIEQKMEARETNCQSAKVETLAMKRKKLQQDIVKYGVAAIKRLYRQQQARGRAAHKAPYKMKPVPQDVHFDEVDARSILKPYSHDKYIKEPKPAIVYVSRREGLVPLTSLNRDSRAEKGERLDRSQVMKKLRVDLKEYNLRDPEVKRFFTPDATMQPLRLFGKQGQAFGMARHLKGHLTNPKE